MRNREKFHFYRLLKFLLKTNFKPGGLGGFTNIFLIRILIDTADFTRQFKLSYCITCHAAQGSTFDCPYTIYQFNMMDARLKYVAFFRSTKQQYMNIIKKKCFFGYDKIFS